MAIDTSKLLRVEWTTFKNSPRCKLSIFKCNNCSNEIRTRPSYIKKHSGLCKTCNGKRTIRTAIGYNKLRPFEAKYNIFLNKNPETNVRYQDYLEFTKIPDCAYCEDLIPWKEYDSNNNGFYLDRKQNELGHIKGNLVVCCSICNMTKRAEFTYEEFMLLGPALKLIRLNRTKT